MISRYRNILWVILGWVAFGHILPAQAQQARAVIDTLRWGFDFKSAEAEQRANRAQHLDSTYYVGYLIEAYHQFEKAEEHTGLAKAVAPLRKSIELYEKDFGYTLGKQYTREQIFSGAWRDLFRQLDYFDLSNRLINCYISLEQPDSAYRAARRLQQADFIFDFQAYHWLAWLYFRTRIYDSSKYAFLKNSIEANLQAAFDYTDSLEMRYQKNTPFIRSQILGAVIPGSPFYNAFESSFIKGPLGVIANTRGILYGYNFQPEEAARYFKMMDSDESVAKMVNLGYTYHAAIDFREAERYFSNVPDQGSRSRGGHWQGYSTLFVYKGNPLEGALTLQQERDKHGFTIGYGWDNLCLARMYLYSGYIEECGLSLEKADKFTEVHYNTSFREDQYRFLLKTLQLLKTHYEIKTHQFENRNRWLSWNWWKNMPELTYLKYTTVYQLANELAQNPERDMVYYHLFHTESIISFDELWMIIRNYSNSFFRNTFRKLQQEDPRPNLDRYYRYFRAMLMRAEGQDHQAFDALAEILNDPKLDREYEKLLIARIHENCAEIAHDNDWAPQEEFHLNELYRLYPQLLPYSDARMKFRLVLSSELENSDRPAVAAALDRLNDMSIDWAPEENSRYPEVALGLAEGDRLTYQVTLPNREVFTQGMVETGSGDPGKTLAYRLFKILR
ncbi:MAG: hypothetical protein H6628_07080 [Calditrichae bacterium]|nr:hypothetical protein [Calditrichia bacterium]